MPSEFLIYNSTFYVDSEPVIDTEKLSELIKQYLRIELVVNKDEYKDKTSEEAKEMLADVFKTICETKHSDIPSDHLEDIERKVAISIVDKYWTQHIDNMYKLRDGVNYLAYAQVDPLNAYVNDGYKMFTTMANNIALEVSMYTLNMKIVKVEEPQKVEESQV